MTQRLLRISVLSILPSMKTRHLAVLAVMVAVSLGSLLGFGPAQTQPNHILKSTIAFTSDRDQPPQQQGVTPHTDIYLMDPDGTNVRRLTFTAGEGNIFPILSPDGKKIVFESNRNRLPTEPVNTSYLFVMNADGSELSALTRGGSASWSPDSKNIVFHESQSGTGLPINADAGQATTDSDILVLNVDDCLKANQRVNPDRTKGDCRKTAPGLVRNLTNNGAARIDDDPDWSPDGKTIAFASLGMNDVGTFDPKLREIFLIHADGTGQPTRRTTNLDDDRVPDWSPDGTRLAFVCQGGGNDFEICFMNADGTGLVQLTVNATYDFGIPGAMVILNDVRPMWSPDGQKILFARPWKPDGVRGAPAQQLFVMNANGTGEVRLTNANPGVAPLRPGVTSLASWGVLRVKAP